MFARIDFHDDLILREFNIEKRKFYPFREYLNSLTLTKSNPHENLSRVGITFFVYVLKTLQYKNHSHKIGKKYHYNFDLGQIAVAAVNNYQKLTWFRMIQRTKLEAAKTCVTNLYELKVGWNFYTEWMFLFFRGWILVLKFDSESGVKHNISASYLHIMYLPA